MKTKQALFNFLQSATPKSFKNVIPVKFRVWISRKLDYGTSFEGWGMKTTRIVPWKAEIGNESFLHANQDIKEHFEFSDDVGANLHTMDELMWRHWIVSYSVRHAIKFSNGDFDFVECGVCDGVTAYFALREMQGLGGRAKIHLYDAWAPMRGEELLEPEQFVIGQYSNISLQRVKKNLNEFDNVVYHPGYIPNSLDSEPSSPDKICYIHIDLNSAMPTIAALEYFFPRIVRGGVILFDDYGSNNYKTTKEAVDKFFSDKRGILMPQPTGQAIYYR